CMACSVEDGASEPNGPARGLPWPAQSSRVKISRAPSWSKNTPVFIMVEVEGQEDDAAEVDGRVEDDAAEVDDRVEDDDAEDDDRVEVEGQQDDAEEVDPPAEDIEPANCSFRLLAGGELQDVFRLKDLFG
ncbi:Palmitoyltransferase SWF1, partial [Frankliniella fusca]